MKKKDITLHENMKPAAIDLIFVWIVLFAMFVSIFFFIINYASIIRTKDTIDALADYGANYIGTNGVGDDLSATMNSIATKSFANINADTSVICSAPVSNNTFQVTFIVTSTNNSFYFYNGQLSSRRVVFNQQDSTGITCNLSVTLNN